MTKVVLNKKARDWKENTGYHRFYYYSWVQTKTSTAVVDPWHLKEEVVD